MRRWASISRMPALHSGPRQHGLTLIELLLFIVVVAIALSAMLKVFVTATAASADPMIRRQQLAIAESLLREVELMPFTWCDPDDPNATTVTSAAGCTTPETSTAEPGESRYGPNYFDNVSDYAGFSMNGIADISGTAVAGLAGYKAAVKVENAQLDSSVPSAETLKITVTVTAPDNSALSLQGWRTRHAPTAAD